MSTIDILQAYAETTDQQEADAYMTAYAVVYGCDSAPYWEARYGDITTYGVEQTLAAEGR